MLDPDIRKRLSQPVANAFGTEPTEEEVTTSKNSMANVKPEGPDNLAMELLKLRLQQDQTILLEELRRFTTLIWSEGNVP